MPFGQMGLMANTGSGGSVGGGWDIFGDIIDTAGQIFGPGGAFGGPVAGPQMGPPIIQQQAPFLPAVIPPVVSGTIGGLAGGALAELLPGLLGGNGNGMVGAPPGIFTTPTTGTMKPRAKNKVQFFANGECITYFKATPDRWKINASNIRGRRKHRHPR